MMMILLGGAEFLQTWSVLVWKPCPSEVTQQGKLIQHRFPKLTWDQIELCVKARAEHAPITIASLSPLSSIFKFKKHFK